MVIRIFGNTVVRPGSEEAEARLADKLRTILRQMPGFISYKTYVAEDGEEIGLSASTRGDRVTPGPTKACSRVERARSWTQGDSSAPRSSPGAQAGARSR